LAPGREYTCSEKRYKLVGEDRVIGMASEKECLQNLKQSAAVQPIGQESVRKAPEK
jgi:hypothetical protein